MWWSGGATVTNSEHAAILRGMADAAKETLHQVTGENGWPTWVRREQAAKALLAGAEALEALERIRQDLETIAAGKEEEVRNDACSRSEVWGVEK